MTSKAIARVIEDIPLPEEPQNEKVPFVPVIYRDDLAPPTVPAGTFIPVPEEPYTEDPDCPECSKTYGPRKMEAQWVCERCGHREAIPVPDEAEAPQREESFEEKRP